MGYWTPDKREMALEQQDYVYKLLADARTDLRARLERLKEAEQQLTRQLKDTSAHIIRVTKDLEVADEAWQQRKKEKGYDV